MGAESHRQDHGVEAVVGGMGVPVLEVGEPEGGLGVHRHQFHQLLDHDPGISGCP